MDGLQRHYAQRHALSGPAFDTRMTERNSVQFPFRHHRQSNDSSLPGQLPRPPQMGAVSSWGAVTSLTSLPSSNSLGSSAECDSDSEFTDEEEGAGRASCHGVSSDVKKMIKYLLCKVQWHLYFSSVYHCANSSMATSAMRAFGNSADRLNSPSLSACAKNYSAMDTSEDAHLKKRRKVKRGIGADPMTLCRFACPFYKHDPQIYGSRRSCSGPGWPTVHKMKQHLYRAHAEPTQCPRCHLVVDTDADLRNHIRGEPCPVAEPHPMEGITREQLQILTKRAAPCRLEEDKWMDVYRLLFPGELEADLPSPCKLLSISILTIADLMVVQDYEHGMATERSRQFRRDLLRMIRIELFSLARRATGQVEEHLLGNIAGIVQRCQRELISSRQSTAQNTPNRTPQTSPQQSSVTNGSCPSEYHIPPPLQVGSSDSDSFLPCVTDEEPYHVDWNALFPDPYNDVLSLSSATATPQSLSHLSPSREVQMTGA
ncbi:hypothetical protein FKW77_006447 [Venturia effusa]|uniref:C2H2-type domain-containing protein n=1 Tax=Venturia effusa TaxID=50376 RepID=A0A517LIY0_9PEZI|nr:hypothetical protein FKW77_006447 [Venturia effusa]